MVGVVIKPLEDNSPRIALPKCASVHRRKDILRLGHYAVG